MSHASAQHGSSFSPADRLESATEIIDSQADTLLISDLREALGYTSYVNLKAHPLGPAAGDGKRFDAHTSALAPGPLGEFEIIDEIGRGGMGIVYRARQPSLGREVAIKILNGQFASSGFRLERFRTETRAIARLNHPNIVPIYAQGECGSTYYYAMGLVKGCSLDVAIHQRPEMLSSTALHRNSTLSNNISGGLSPSAASVGETTGEADVTPPPPRTAEDYRHLAVLLADVADGLGHAHDHGVIHRDVKPQNLLVSADGRMYVSDFGLSRLLDEPRLTLTGELMGTPAYLSPEQVRGDESQIDHRTDIYSLGVTLYEILCGRRPFQARNRDQVIRSICNDEPVRPRSIDRHIPPDLETICLRAIAKEPKRRFATAHEMAEELRRVAACKTIHSKAPNWGSRAVRGMGRHRGVIGIGLLTALCLVLGSGYSLSYFASRRDQSNALLQQAYEQLVYFDYRSPQLVANQVDKAEALGADPLQLDMVKALMSLGRSDNPDAISRLRSVVNRSSSSADSSPKYLLAWALWRDHQTAESRAVFEQASAVGEPTKPDEWFFRGLASHFDRPNLALEAYQRANELRAAKQLFFPQAILHLARAYNQQMYSARDDGVFESAQAILMQLIKQGHYRAYPYYLLSITQRLSGDIQGVALGSDSPQVQTRYRDALESARQGQQVDPNDERPITAEAECLERLDLLADALEARNRAFAIASTESNRCEALHYRWRLHYWLDNFEAAQKDIASHAQCMPDSLPYAHVYHSWVAAEAGDVDQALAEARAPASEAPDDAQAVLWSAACLQFLGHAGEAMSLLEKKRDAVRMNANLVPPQSEAWMSALFDFAMSRRTLEELLALADKSQEPRKLRAEGFFHAAMKALGRGEIGEAKLRLEQAVSCFDSEVRYTYHARTLLERMEKDAHWPHWLEEKDANQN